MKKVNWLIEKYVFSDYEDKLVKSIKNSGNNVILYDESKISLENICKKFNDGDIVILHSSLQDGRRMLKTSCYPGIYLTLKNYECYNYYGYFGEYLLNSKYLMMGINDLIRNKDMIFNHLGGDKIFIRPSNGFKSFTGQILPKNDFENYYNTLIKSYGGIDLSTLVLLSPAQDIEDEYRFIVIDGELVSGSLYMNKEYREKWEAIYDKECNDREAFSFAKKMVELYQPDKMYTIDICKTNNNEYKLIELNSFCCASMYGNNYDKVVKSVNNLCIKDWKDVYEI